MWEQAGREEGEPKICVNVTFGRKVLAREADIKRKKKTGSVSLRESLLFCGLQEEKGDT